MRDPSAPVKGTHVSVELGLRAADHGAGHRWRGDGAATVVALRHSLPLGLLNVKEPADVIGQPSQILLVHPGSCWKLPCQTGGRASDHRSTGPQQRATGIRTTIRAARPVWPMGQICAHLLGMTAIRLPFSQSSATASRARCGCALLRANFLRDARVTQSATTNAGRRGL